MTTEPKTEPTPEPEPLTDEELANFDRMYFRAGCPARVLEGSASVLERRLRATVAARDEALEKTRALVAEVRRVCDEARDEDPGNLHPDYAEYQIAARLRPHLPKEGKGL